MHATDLAVAIGAGIAVADLVLEPDHGVAQAINYAVIGGSLAFLLYRGHAAALVARAGGQLGRGRGRLAVDHGIRLSEIRAGVRPVSIGQCQRGATLPHRGRHSIAGGVFRMAVRWQFISICPSTRSVASKMVSWPASSDLCWNTRRRSSLLTRHTSPCCKTRLGNRIALTLSRGARGRLYLLSTLPTADTLVGTRDTMPVQR